ncbi:myosin heavy chain, clone 203-like, partial [Strongylocentrotus purpuratus]|uniref:Death domain-containing protein n=1 Tax=Strongylocentrotus purpuratus TaxID=7668 RepID=A0A7M7T4G5_STRPU
MASKRALNTPEKVSSHPKILVLQTPEELESQAAGLGCNSPPAWFVNYLEQFHRMEERIDSLVINKLEELSLKTKENEEKLEACCIQVDTVVAEIKKLKKENDDLLLKLGDLENRGRRNNLIFHGVTEKAKENYLEVVRDFISNFVGIQSTSYNIERCHRTPTTKGSRQGSESERVKPRIIHIAFSSFVAKEEVRRACIAKLKKESRAPLCAILPFGDTLEARNELKRLGITDMYEVPGSGSNRSYEEQLQLLDLLRGCLYKGDRTLAANDLKKMCTNPRCSLFYEKTKKEVKEAKEANQKMFTEVQEQNQELKKGREEDRKRSEKEKRSLAAEMTKKLESKQQHVDTLTEIVGEKERNETTLTQQVEELKRGREEDRVKAEKDRGRSEEAKRSLAEEMRKKLDSKQQHVNTLTETVGNKERNETTLTQQVKELEKGRKQDRARSEKEKRSMAADMTKKLFSQQQRVDTLIETVREKERNETTLRQQVEELKKEHDYKEQLLEQLERETWKLRTKIQLESEIRSAEQKKKAETHQWSFIPWVTSGKQAQGGTSSFEDNSSGGLGRSETLQAGEEPPEDEFAGILQQIADDLYDEAKIDSLAGQLGILHGDIQRALMTNVKFNRVTSDGTRHMLKQWREGVSREDERVELTKALKAAKLVNLADLYLSTGVAEEQIDDEYDNEDVNDQQLSNRDETSLEQDRTKGHTDIQVLQEATSSSIHPPRDGHSGDMASKTQEELTDGSRSQHIDQLQERSTEDFDIFEVDSEDKRCPCHEEEEERKEEEEEKKRGK